MPGLGLSLPEVAGRIRGGGAVPPVSIDTVVIEGDSITSGVPGTPNGFFSYQYADARPDKTIHVRAQGSRTVGAAAELNDDGNTLIGNVAEDLAYGPQLITAMIGANDLTSGTATAHRGHITGYFSALKTAAPAVKFAWSPPLPYNPTGAAHPNYANFTAQRAALLATCRDPAVWGQWADVYLPLGEHPDFADTDRAGPLFGDSVHPSMAGQALLFASYRVTMDTILDPSRTNASSPYEATWPGSETNLPISTAIVRRFIVAGIAHGGLAAGVGVLGAGAQLRLNGGGYGPETGRIYNGDIIDLRLTTSENNSTLTTVELRIGSETRAISFATGAQVTPASYAHGGIQNIQPAGPVHAWPVVPFDHAGIGVLAIKADGAAPVTVEVAAAGTGEWTGAVRRFTRPVAGQGALDVWTIPIDTSGDRGVRVTYAGFRAQSTLAWGVVRDADADPVQAESSAPASQSQPHLTGNLTIPAGGIAVAVFGEYGGASIVPAATNGDTAFVAEGSGAYQGETHGIAVATRAASGPASWNFAFGTHPRGALVFAAAEA